MKLSVKARNLKASSTADMLSRVETLKRSGENIISLNVGEPDAPTPEHIKEAGIAAIRDNFTRYTPVNGIEELRVAIAAKFARENLIQYGKDEVTVAIGAKQAIAAALTAILDEGDEVIIPVPCYVSYPEMVKLSGGKSVLVPKLSDYQLDLAAIEKSITNRTKAVIICTPNNPTGAVYKEESLRALAALALEHDFFVLADEVYEKIVYDGAKHFSIASISPEVRDHTITVNAFSKTYAMTGWRLGYAGASREVTAAINRILSQTTTTTSSISQKAALAALNGPQDAMQEMVSRLERRKNYVMDRLQEMPGIRCPEVQGAFYVFPDITACLGKSIHGKVLETDADLCNYLLEDYHIAMMPGSAYFQPGHVRISYSTSMDNLSRAMDALQEGLTALMHGEEQTVHAPDWRENYAAWERALANRREPVPSPRVVYQGEPGAFSEMAAVDFFGEVGEEGGPEEIRGMQRFHDTFEALRKGEADYAVLPIENSSTGAIRQVYDLLTQYECYIVGETSVSVQQSLMGLPGTTLDQIATVYSHEQGLFQCEDYLSQFSWRQVTQDDTAGSAKLVASLGDPTKAAICSARAAKIYGLEILAENINTNANNTTRFVVVSPQVEMREGRNKTCIAITAAHHSGSLHEILTIFALHGLNLVKLESRPVQGRNWEYMFFIEFTGDLLAPGMDEVMQELAKSAYDIRVFGNFRANLGR